MYRSADSEVSGLHSGYHTSAEPATCPSYSPPYAAADMGASLAFDPKYSWDSRTTLDTAHASASCSWGSLGQVLPPEAASISHSQDSFVLDPLTDSRYLSYDDSYNTGMSSTRNTPVSEDINSWDFDTIKEVAESLYASMKNGRATDYGCPIMWDEGTSSQAPTTAAEGLCSVGSPEEVLPSTSNGAQGRAPGGEKSHRRAKKMYQLNPQDHPELEKRIKNALKQYRKRLRDEEHERSLNRTLTLETQQVSQLRKEKEERLRAIAKMEDQLAILSIGQPTIYQHGDFQQPHASGDYLHLP